MNTAKLKAYAPQARKDFIKAVTERANYYGIFSDDHIEPIEFKGDVAIVGERAFTKREGELRERLVDRIKRDRFELVMRACAYTWFNRFVALRYMELHDYLEHGYRVLSNNRNSDIPEMLEHAADVNFEGLDKDKIVELRLAGNKDNELYRLLIVAQCNALHKAMPFLFEQIDSEIELLLPDNLLHSASPIRKMVTEIDEEDWNDIEIIGWIYQFYISERKDEVIGKVVQSEDIPAATQLFTPRWIVKYMVQNTLGKMWLSTYPDSLLKDKMEFYIKPAEQEIEIQEQLDSITPKELNPEEITFLDPACGSGHILVEAYDILKEIYLERGYRTKDIPLLILEKNLYGFDIDLRAIQLSGFILIMKARADNHRLLKSPMLPNILGFQHSKYIDSESCISSFFPNINKKADEKSENIKQTIRKVINVFKEAKTLGSLQQIAKEFSSDLAGLKKWLTNTEFDNDLFSSQEKKNLIPFIDQAFLLGKKYDVIVTNPPYIGKKVMNITLKRFAKKYYNNSKSDLYSMFIESCILKIRKNGYLSFVTPYSWMFLSSYEKFRNILLDCATIISLIQLEFNAFELAGIPVATFTIIKNRSPNYLGDFIKLSDFRGYQNQGPKTLEAIANPQCGYRYQASTESFKKIPGSPISYWVPDQIKEVFQQYKKLSEISKPKQGLASSDNERFLRLWHEVSFQKIGFNCSSRAEAIESKKKWFPYNKGGRFRKWYGNNEFIVNWESDGKELKEFQSTLNQGWHVRLKSREFYFKPSLSWTFISLNFGVRYSKGFIFDVAGSSIFPSEKNIYYFAGFLCSRIADYLMQTINPTMNFQIRDVALLPINMHIGNSKAHTIENNVKNAINISKRDWDFYEISWDFESCPLTINEIKAPTIEGSFFNWKKHIENQIKTLQEIEVENNRLFIEAYNLQDELNPEVLKDHITLTPFDHETDVKRLISYAIGCMMGRYSLDQTGLVYAHSGNQGFDSSKYKTFPADDDGIIPILDQDWFPDDATNRFVEFLKVAWSPETLDENLRFVADSIKPKNNETPVDTIRRYLSTNFYKDQIKTYKKRTIYWLFSSGRKKAFECLVYLHRYNESTLSRIRSTYVTPLQGNISARLEFLQNEKYAAATASAQRKIQKEIDVIRKKQTELSAFDDELRHFADMKISLDLDDGVKVNYGKFGNLLAEKKTITGKK